MRGEDPLRALKKGSMEGSPPHARGRLTLFSSRYCQSRITPACAGKTCGRPAGKTGTIGSPPHARGRRVYGLWYPRSERITPACAGKTSTYGAYIHSHRDHPRMRGEDHRFLFGGDYPSGSPPHARGRPAPRPRAGREERITPACAGKTSLAPFSGLRSWDHPRMRGEDICDR